MIQADATPTPRQGISALEVLSGLLVLALTLAALLAGLLLRNSVESRVKTYSDPSGWSLQYPDGWQVNATDAERGIVRVRDLTSGRFPTTIEVRRVVVDASAPATETLGFVSDSLSTDRGRELTAFKVFSVRGDLTLKDRPAAESRYVFVNAPTTAFQENVPAVVMGKDYLIHKGDKVYIFTLHATEPNFDAAQSTLDRVVEGAELP